MLKLPIQALSSFALVLALAKVAPAQEVVLKDVYGLGFSADAKTFIAAEAKKLDFSVILWDTGTWKKQGVIPVSFWPGTVAISPDRKQVATGGIDPMKSAFAARMPDGGVDICDLSRGLATVKPRTIAKGLSLWRLAFSPDSKTLALSGLDNRLKLWDVNDQRIKANFDGERITALAFAPDGNVLAGGTSAGKTEQPAVRFWNSKNGKILASVEHKHGVTCLAYSPKGSLLAAGGGNFKYAEHAAELKVWDTQTRKLRVALEGHKSAIEAVAFSPDGKKLASAAWAGDNFSYASEIKLWDIETGKVIVTFKGHTSSITALAFAANGSEVYSASKDGTIRRWQINKKPE